eukprot:CAMPEP_0181486266 /NCGR_PEP_ID=MMETSP1110-20121109/47041_1 /TAXON_ID=174948 /ORGANISM="Symbiodinium sp., Strain CCMP421" /LENGTH=62 /DNA_ID=CAMNT_0023612389 /DNA_START=131 /DNA_END=319 /DNA_ORIENTATION=-
MLAGGSWVTGAPGPGICISTAPTGNWYGVMVMGYIWADTAHPIAWCSGTAIICPPGDAGISI